MADANEVTETTTAQAEPELDQDAAELRAVAKAAREAREAEAGQPAEAEETQANGTQEEAPANDTAGDEPADGVVPPPAEPPKPTALFTSALREREKATKAQEQLKAERAAFDRERAEFDRDKAEVAAWRAKMKQVDDDPWAYFDVFQVDRTEHARRLMTLQTPEAVEIERLRRRVDEGDKQREEREKAQAEERRKAEEAEREQAYERNVAASKQSFASFVAEKAEAYPTVAGWPRKFVVEEMWSLAAEHHKNTGEVPTLEMLVDHLERTASEYSGRGGNARQPQGAVSPSANSVSPSEQRQTGQPANSPGPRTLTNAASTQRTVVTPDKGIDDDERDRRELRAVLRQRNA